jgi:hypothetical protein
MTRSHIVACNAASIAVRTRGCSGSASPCDRRTVRRRAVAGFDLSDLSLTLGGGTNLLAGSAASLSTTDHVTWTVGGLAGLTAPPGTYVLTLAATGSGITDLLGRPLGSDASLAWSR